MNDPLIESIKLAFFVAGLVCLCEAVVLGAQCLVPAAVFWAALHFRNDLFDMIPQDPDYCDPAQDVWHN